MSSDALFRQLGLTPINQVKKTRRVMIGTEGLTNSGKTEFLLSVPGPKVIVAIDCGHDSALDNPYPPKTRLLTDTAIDEIFVPTAANLASTNEYGKHFMEVRGRTYKYCDTPDLRAMLIDGDSDLWELQLLAEFGRTSQIHPLSYPMVDGMRRYMTKRWWRSGKIIIGTNKIKPKYEDVIDEATGLVMKDEKGKNVQVLVKGEYKRQGFRDQDYIWQIQIRHLYEPGAPIDLTQLKPIERLKAVREGRTKTLPRWGLRILKCKPNPRLEGDELWDGDCNFAGLVQHIYPEVELSEWGF